MIKTVPYQMKIETGYIESFAVIGETGMTLFDCKADWDTFNIEIKTIFSLN